MLNYWKSAEFSAGFYRRFADAIVYGDDGKDDIYIAPYYDEAITKRLQLQLIRLTI